MNGMHLGYFENFGWSDEALLFEGDANGLRALAEILRALASSALDAVAIHRLPFVKAYGGVQLTAKRGPHDRGTRCLQAGRPVVLWERTEDGWAAAAEKIEVLVSGGQGHHRLDAQEDEVDVQVSRDEYGVDWWSDRT